MSARVCAYAPTLDANDTMKETFYAELDQVITNTSNKGRLLILADFSAYVGSNYETWTPIGYKGIGKII